MFYRHVVLPETSEHGEPEHRSIPELSGTPRKKPGTPPKNLEYPLLPPPQKKNTPGTTQKNRKSAKSNKIKIKSK